MHGLRPYGLKARYSLTSQSVTGEIDLASRLRAPAVLTALSARWILPASAIQNQEASRFLDKVRSVKKVWRGSCNEQLAMLGGFGVKVG